MGAAHAPRLRGFGTMLFFAHFAQGELRRTRPAARLSVGAAFPIYFIRSSFDITPPAKRPECPKGR
jgi:hypothetical protein